MEGPEAAYVQSDLYADVMAEPVQQNNTVSCYKINKTKENKTSASKTRNI